MLAKMATPSGNVMIRLSSSFWPMGCLISVVFGVVPCRRTGKLSTTMLLLKLVLETCLLCILCILWKQRNMKKDDYEPSKQSVILKCWSVMIRAVSRRRVCLQAFISNNLLTHVCEDILLV